MSLYEPQPAHLMYPFDGGWQVMRYVRANVFARTDATARTWFNRADDWTSKADQQDSKLLKYWFYCMVAGFWLAGASQYTTAMVLVATFMLIQFTILVLWAALVMLTVGVLMLFNYVYGSYHRIFFRCPTAGCYHQMTIPIYVCPTCATQHTRLWPSVYGIFRQGLHEVLESGVGVAFRKGGSQPRHAPACHIEEVEFVPNPGLTDLSCAACGPYSSICICSLTVVEGVRRKGAACGRRGGHVLIVICLPYKQDGIDLPVAQQGE